MPGQVPQKIREERNHRLLQMVNEIAKRRYDALVGRQVQILVEGPSKKNPARHDRPDALQQNRGVRSAGRDHCGRLLDVNITRAGSFTLYGEPAAAADVSPR